MKPEEKKACDGGELRLLKGMKNGGWVEVLGVLSTRNGCRQGGRGVSEKGQFSGLLDLGLDEWRKKGERVCRRRTLGF